MLQLSMDSGLPLSIEQGTGQLYLNSSLTSEDPKTRFLSESTPYYETKNYPENDLPLYYMYRDVRRIFDISTIQNSKLRYDITVVLPGLVGDELIKTIGHVHPLSTQTNVPYTYTEVYSVIYGTAHYILQKYSEDFTKILDIVDLEVHTGEHVFIPSFYGHVTVNVTKEPLVMANILYRDFLSNYEPYRKNQGAAIYLKHDQKNIIQTVFNTRYVNLPPSRKAKAQEFIPSGLEQGKPLYTQWINNLDGFTYLYKEN
jgi:glucose-6-phosphate isomerase